MRYRSRGIAALVLLAASAAAGAGEPVRPEIEAFVEEMATRHAMNRAELRRTLLQARVQPAILRAMSAQTTARPWHQYRPLYVNAERIAGGLRFWEANAASLVRAAGEYGVPEELIVATIGVETVYGRVTGTHRVLDALATLAFDFPRRAEFFRGELEQFLLLARDGVLDPLQAKGSYAGAIGIPQFMPSSYQRYAVDFDGDGRIRLAESTADAIGSVANYYRTFGWQTGRPVAVRASADGEGYAALAEQGIEPRFDAAALRQAGVTTAEDIGEASAALLVLQGADGPQIWLGLPNFYVITRYNRSVNYAMSVFELAREIRAARTASGR